MTTFTDETVVVTLDHRDALTVIRALQLLGAVSWAAGTSGAQITGTIIETIERGLDGLPAETP